MTPPHTPPDQPRLFEFSMGERDVRTHVVSQSNRAACDLLLGWQAWPGGAAVLAGPAGSGRSHLAQVWAQASGALAWRGDVAPADMFQRAQGRVLVDDADQGRDEEDLIRLFDLARSHGGAVLFVALDGARRWQPRVPDLRSRLAAAPLGVLHEPDLRLLEVVLRRLCRDRFLELSDEAVAYLLARMERSFAAARRLADALDAGLPRGGRHPIKVATVRRVVGDMVTGLGAYADDEGDAAP